MTKLRTTVTLSPVVKEWMEKNKWFNASYELEKVIRAQMDKDKGGGD